jgi:hypothetical protein
MTAHAGAHFIGILLAMGLISGAGAMELTQSPGPSSPEAPGFSLPAFLDGARLPDLQEAWRAHFGAVEAPAAAAAADAAAPIAGPESSSSSGPDAAALQAADAAVARAEEAGREAATVRERAEELSRRFDAGTTEAAAPSIDSSVVPTETAATGASSGTGDTPDPAAEQAPTPPAQESAAVEQPAPPPAKNAASDNNDAPVIEEMARKPAKRVKRAAAPQQQTAQTAAHKTPPAATDLPKVDPEASKPESDPMLPDQLRAFGWNAQP